MGWSKFQHGLNPRLLSHLECYMSLPRVLKDVQIRMTRIIWDLRKKNLIWRQIEKISGVYSGKELNKKGCDKSLCCQGCGKGMRWKGTPEVCVCLSLCAEMLQSLLGKIPGRVAGELRAFRRSQKSCWGWGHDLASKGKGHKPLPKRPTLPLRAIINSDKEAATAFFFFHVSHQKA